MRRSAPWFVSALCVCLALSAAAQNGQQSTTQLPTNSIPVIRSNSRAVAVDVVVTSRTGEPIATLHQQDLQVFEDGKPQTIDLFQVHSTPESAVAASPAPLPAGVYTNQPAFPHSEAVNVLLLDNLNTAPADQANVHRRLKDFLGNAKPAGAIAVYSLNSTLRPVQAFTIDGGLLRAALDSKAAKTTVNLESRNRNDDLRDKEETFMVGEMSANKGAADMPSHRAKKGHASICT